MLYAIIWGMSFLGTLSLIKSDRYAGMNIAYGMAQIILFLSIIIYKWILY